MALRAIWQFMDRDVTHKILYGPKLRSIYYFVGDRPVHKLPLGPKCHELFVISYSIHAICQTTCFCYCISKTKNEFGHNSEENIILIGSGPYTKILTGQYTKILSGFANKDK
jgi:hypothetical protein